MAADCVATCVKKDISFENDVFRVKNSAAFGELWR
jgi:hypothetical protein